MKKLSLICLIICTSLAAQAIDKYPKSEYIRYPKAMELNLPQCGMSMKLPAETGVKYPCIRYEATSLEPGEQSYFFLDFYQLEYHPESIILEFALQGEKTSFLRFYPIPFMNGNHDDLLQYLEENPGKGYADYVKKESPDTYGDSKYIKSFETPLGQSLGIEMDDENGDLGDAPCVYDTQIVYHKGWTFYFFYKRNVTSRQREAIKEILGSLQGKDLEAKLKQYEKQVESGDLKTAYSRNKKASPMDAYAPLRISKDSLTVNTTFSYPLLDMSFTVPAGWVFRGDARSINDSIPGSRVITLNDVDLTNEMTIYASFYHVSKDDPFIIDASIRINLVMNKQPKELIESLVKDVKSREALPEWDDITVCGIPGKAGFYTKKEFQNFVFYLPFPKRMFYVESYFTKDYTMDIENIISSIRINHPTAATQKDVARKTVSSYFSEEKAIKPE